MTTRRPKPRADTAAAATSVAIDPMAAPGEYWPELTVTLLHAVIAEECGVSLPMLELRQGLRRAGILHSDARRGPLGITSIADDRPGIRVFDPEVLQAVMRAIERDPEWTLKDVRWHLRLEHGIDLSLADVRRAMRHARIQYGHPRRGPVAQVVPRPMACGGPDCRYPMEDARTDLSDAEWQLVADLFERPPGRGRPLQHSARRLLDACHYVIRMGCPWRELPGRYPPWSAAYAAFQRWRAAGAFEEMNRRFLQRWEQAAKRRAKRRKPKLPQSLIAAADQ